MTTHTVTTPFGPLDIVPVEKTRLRVETGIPMNVDDRALRINGVDYTVQAWLYRWSDGVWHLGQEDDRMSQLHEPRLSRRGSFGTDDVTRSAIEKARAAIESAVNEWAGENETALQAADVKWLEQELRRAEGNEEEAREAYDEAKEKTVWARAQLINATDRLEGRA